MLKRVSRFFYGLNDAVKKMALMIYLTDFSTASRLNLNNVAKSSAEPNSFELCRDAATSRRNPIQGTVRFRSVG